MYVSMPDFEILTSETRIEMEINVREIILKFHCNFEMYAVSSDPKYTAVYA